MPNLRIWCGLLLALLSPLGFAASESSPASNPVKAPEQPSAALLEFIGDWNDDERQLIGMDTQAETPTRKQNPKEERHAP